MDVSSIGPTFPLFKVYAFLVETLRHSLLQGEGWLTRAVTVEPLQTLQSVDPHAVDVSTEAGRRLRWQLTNPDMPGIVVTYPFDPLRKMKAVSPSTEVNAWGLALCSLALVLTTYIVVYAIEFLIGHTLIVSGMTIFEQGSAFAIGFGLIAGAIAALTSFLGRSSLGGLVVGLVSGLTAHVILDFSNPPTMDVIKVGVIFVGGLATQLVLSLLGRRIQSYVGVLLVIFGVYLQFLPSRLLL